MRVCAGWLAGFWLTIVSFNAPAQEGTLLQTFTVREQFGVSHPDQIIRAARKYGLRYNEHFPGTLNQIKADLRQGHPVMLAIQAWGGRAGGDYIKDWKDGHWVIAIGYDSKAIFFEDPILTAVRGYLRDQELLRRWRDTGRHGTHMPHYALALWHPDVKRSTYATRAERIA